MYGDAFSYSSKSRARGKRYGSCSAGHPCPNPGKNDDRLFHLRNGDKYLQSNSPENSLSSFAIQVSGYVGVCVRPLIPYLASPRP